MNFPEILQKIRKWRSSNSSLVRPAGYSPKFKYDAWISSLPDFYEGYKESLLEHERVAVHAEDDVFPYDILRSKAPNQTKEEWEYQLGLYEPMTNATWGRALNKTKAVANKQNYSIFWPNPEQKKYFYDYYPDYESIEAFFMKVVREEKINYPNKVLVIEPYEVHYKFDSLNKYDVAEDGSFLIDDTKPVEPVARIYDEWQVVHYREREELLLLLELDVNYTDEQNNNHNDGLKFRHFTKNEIIDIIQTGKDEFTKTVVLKHGYNWLPAVRLKGVSKGKYYKSAFHHAIPKLNEAIRVSSTKQVITHTLAFPVRVMLVDPCNYTDANGNSCSGGKIWSEIDNAHIICPSCNGSGKNAPSPTSIIEVLSRDARPGSPKVELPAKPYEVISPDFGIIEHLDNQEEKLCDKAFSMFFETDKATAETATGKQLEKEEWQTFMSEFAPELFGLMAFAIEAIGEIKFKGKFEKPKILVPKQFNFRTPESITDEVAKAKEAGLPVTFQRALLEEATETRFGSSDMIKSDIELQMNIDKIFYMSTLEARAVVGSTLTRKDALLHQNFASYLAKARDEHEDFDTLDARKKEEIIMNYASEDAKDFEKTFSGVDGTFNV